ncbi:MAG: ATP-binding protein [Pseudomonadota bacterium]
MTRTRIQAPQPLRARTSRRALARVLAGATALGGLAHGADGAASGLERLSALDPTLVAAVGAGALAAAALIWAARASTGARRVVGEWSTRLAEMEARLENAESVLSAYRGLILVWRDGDDPNADGWGGPKVLGGPAALASLMAFAGPGRDEGDPVDRLLDAIGDLDVVDSGAEPRSLRQKVSDLRRHGVPFIGAVRTSEGRAIEVEGAIAGGQAALWLTDPAARVTETGGVLGRTNQTAEDLHGALGLLEGAPCPAWRRAADGRILWVNAAYADAVEARGASVVVADQIELDAAVRRLADRAAREKAPAEARIAVNVRGDRRMFRIIERPAHIGGDAGLCGFAVDVTEEAAAQSELTRHVDANKRLLDQIPVAVAMFGVGQELSYYNAAFQTLWGLDAAELDAKPMFGDVLDRLRQAGRLPEQADYRRWKAGQLSLYTEETPPGADRSGAAPDDVWPLPDGRTLRVAKARHPLGGVIAVFEDITERLRFEALHNTQIKVQRATLNNLSEGVATFGSDGRLKLANDAFGDLWRLDAAFVDARPHIEAVLERMRAFTADGGDARSLVRRRVTSMTAEDRTPIDAHPLALTDGRTLSFGTEPLPDGATMIHFLDVTDSCEREKELKERNAFLEDIDRQKSKFVDHVSYQLRTPLNTIIGFSEMIDGQMFGVLNDRQRDYVSSVLSAAYSLKDLISDIMDLAAIDAGKMTLDESDLDIRELLTNAAAYAALKAEDTEISLRVDCADGVGTIRADERRMKQVLFNLLSNAFAYTGPGGEVTLNADRTPGLVRIWVEDSGRGVSPEDQARAFEAFEASGPSAGAGLGLALVQRFVSLHGGWVRMESAPGSGTRVTLYLPSEPRSGSGSPLEASDAAGESDGKLVLTEKLRAVEKPAARRKAAAKSRARRRPPTRKAAE